MSDLALSYDPIAGHADLCVEDGDLVLDAGLGSLALMSLLTDARAEPEEAPGESDLRGWWGDQLLERPLGGKLWLLGRAKTTPENQRRAQDYAEDALAWLVEDGVAGRVDVLAERLVGVGSGATLRIDVSIERSGGGRVDLRYDRLWEAMA